MYLWDNPPKVWYLDFKYWDSSWLMYFWFFAIQNANRLILKCAICSTLSMVNLVNIRIPWNFFRISSSNPFHSWSCILVGFCFTCAIFASPEIISDTSAQSGMLWLAGYDLSNIDFLMFLSIFFKINPAWAGFRWWEEFAFLWKTNSSIYAASNSILRKWIGLSFPGAFPWARTVPLRSTTRIFATGICVGLGSAGVRLVWPARFLFGTSTFFVSTAFGFLFLLSWASLAERSIRDFFWIGSSVICWPIVVIFVFSEIISECLRHRAGCSDLQDVTY